MTDSADQQPAMSGEFIVYRSDDGRTEVQLRPVDGTVWMTQRQMAQLFGVTTQAVSAHVLAIVRDGELDDSATFKKLLKEPGQDASRSVNHYNLDMILAVGYRIRGPRGIQFRQWATTVLGEYLVKGFAMDDNRIKKAGAVDYFDELLERIRDIRASEKLFYQKVRDLFAQTSVDYDPKSDAAVTFFKTIQNKLLYAVTTHTAAELIVERSDASVPNMGLTSFAGNRVRKADIGTAKNYLTQGEITSLNRVVTMFLDFAEQRASQHEQTTMADWVLQADRFIRFNELPVLAGAGTVQASHAKDVVEQRYSKFDEGRKALERDAAQTEAEAETVAEIEAMQRSIQRRPHTG